MIPVRLQMYNFLSYGEDAPCLDFTEFNIACLSGKNGQGKSALLDALTWAIWGEGRKASQEKKADAGLLKIGKNKMWVDLTLDLEAERYRIIRKFSKTKKRNHTELELQVFDGKKDVFVSLTASSIRQTQQRINRLLRMDYDTFINSAFILQGRVDEFTRKNARARKEILSEVLGLSQYDALSTLARQHGRESQGRIALLDTRIGQLTSQIHQKKSLQEAFQKIRQEEKDQNILIRKTRENLQKLEKKKNRLSFEQEKSIELKRRINTEKKELQEYESRKKKVAQNIGDYQSILSREKEILSAYHAYQNLYRENQQMIQFMQQYRNLDKDKTEIEKQIEKAKNRLQSWLEQKKQKYGELQEKVNVLSKQRSQAEKLALKIKQLEVLKQKQEQIEQQGNQLNVQIENKNNQVQRLESEIQKDGEKIDLLREGKQQYCPLCQSDLDEIRKESIRSKIRKDITANQAEVKRLAEEIIGLRHKKVFLQEQWKKNHDELIQKEEIQNQYYQYNLLVKESEKAQIQIKSLSQEIENLEDQHNQKKFASKERLELAEIEKQMKKLGYDDQKYFAVNRSLEKLREVPLQKEKLKEAQNRISHLITEQEKISQQSASRKSALNRLEQEYEKISREVSDLPALETSIGSEQKSLHRLEQSQSQLNQRRGACQEKLIKITEYEREREKAEQERVKECHQKEVYEKLTIAFGKNGIQSMIIENAIPELEEEANIILSRLSNENTMVSFESLKDLKSGGTKETLDIKIHDEAGIRPYELYSGGETFRIDFAIRIALSKLLAYRSGARLRTLVIDEGFGTQDEEGLQKLIQAIHAISDDFDKILVITHLPLLKDAFPVRIEVWKDPVLGSQFEIIHLS